MPQNLRGIFSPCGQVRRRVACSVVFFVLLPVVLTKCWLLTRGLGEDGRNTYVWAGWKYGAGARFDNTWGTWATDYGIALLCIAQAIGIYLDAPLGQMSSLRKRSIGLLLTYAASTGLGGLTHQLHDGTTGALNTPFFRGMWMVVVGLTAIGGSWFGLIGNELLRMRTLEGVHFTDSTDSASSHRRDRCPRRRPGSRVQERRALSTKAVWIDRAAPVQIPLLSIPGLRDTAWLFWAVVLVVLVVMGVFSCVRPACDVFILGATQALPTFYLQVAVLTASPMLPASTSTKLQLGLMGNVPLIFAYPWLVVHSGLSLGSINAMLHSVIALSWGLQGRGLYEACHALGL